MYTVRIKTLCSQHNTGEELYAAHTTQKFRGLEGFLVLLALKVLELPKDGRQLLKRDVSLRFSFS